MMLMDIKDNSNNEYLIKWRLTDKCNLNCAYCVYRDKDEKESEYILETDIICRNILKTENVTNVFLTGGEPFLHKDIINICKVLTKKIPIKINSNLTIDKKIKEFVDCIDPDAVHSFNISCHIEERERQNKIYDLIKNIDLLKQNGFNPTLNYVLYPSLADRFLDDYAFFNSYGIKLKPSFVRGNFDNKFYPYAYDKNIKDKFISIHKNEYTRSIPINTIGMNCSVNCNKILIKNGLNTKCSYDKTKNKKSSAYENLQFDTDSVKCKKNICNCGINFKYVDFKEVHYYLYEGLFLYVYGDLIVSKEYFLKALSCENNFSTAYNNLGMIEFDLDNFKEASNFFFKALNVSQNNSLYFQNYILSLLKLGEIEKAKNFCTDFLKNKNEKIISNLLELILNKVDIDLRPEVCFDFNVNH